MRPASPLGEHGFDEVDGEYAGYLPRREDQRSEGVGVCDCAQKTLHRRIIIAYAVAQA